MQQIIASVAKLQSTKRSIHIVNMNSDDNSNQPIRNFAAIISVFLLCAVGDFLKKGQAASGDDNDGIVEKDAITDEDYDQFLKHREYLIASSTAKSDLFNKAVLTLSGGALGLSFAFLKDVMTVIQIEVSDTKFLFWAWGLWGAAIIISVVGYHMSYKSFIAARDKADDLVRRNQSPAGVVNTGGGWGLLARWLPVGAFWSFLAGALCLCIFINQNEENNMNDDKKQVKKGIPTESPKTRPPSVREERMPVANSPASQAPPRPTKPSGNSSEK